MRLRPLACLLLALLMMGCGSSSDDLVEAEKPPVAFEGKPDERLVGKWQVPADSSTYTFNQDGTYDFVGKVSTRGGSFDNKFTGAWLVKDDRVLFKDAQGNVVPYVFRIEGDRLTLSLTGSLKNETVMVRQ
ncbi:MAG TPA: hypothetical protein VM328_01360 [Fimbriimonadaceae bacterium]|nr:hypothetical protein [Fimbriimonadaceae bacterium]